MRVLIQMGLLAAAITGTCSVNAASQIRNKYYQAASSCQGALPVYESLLRKRPLAVANEGSSATFVTCGLEMEMAGEVGYPPGSQMVYVVLTNRSTAPVTVNCMLVEGYGGFADSYHPKSIQLQPGEMTDTFAWSYTENAGKYFLWPSISCNLPPGVEINGTTQQYYVPIGS